MRKLLNFYLYSSLHISLGCVALYFYEILRSESTFNPYYVGLIFCSTLFTYSTHRFVGIQKVNSSKEKGRFLVIEKYKSHILLYAVLSALGCLILMFYQSTETLIQLTILGVISILYVLPAFSNNRRLRDLNYIKIFLVAIVWSWVLICIPSTQNNAFDLYAFLRFVECFFFFVAITLPFDIRDISVDTSINVKTIPSHFGVDKSILMAKILLCLALIINIVLQANKAFADGLMIGLPFTYLLGFILVHLSKRAKNDYYFTGLIDGLMLVPILVEFIFLSCTT